MNVSLCFFGAFTTPIRAEVALVRLPLTALIGVCLCNVENRVWSTLLQRSPRPRMLRNLCKCILGRIERGMPRGEGCNKQKMQQGKRERKKKVLHSFIIHFYSLRFFQIFLECISISVRRNLLIMIVLFIIIIIYKFGYFYYGYLSL